jgi:hypothetical protein
LWATKQNALAVFGPLDAIIAPQRLCLRPGSQNMGASNQSRSRVVIQHRQENHHHLVDVASETRVRITIVEDVLAEIDIAMRNLLMTTNENHPRSIHQSKIRKTIPKEIGSSNTTTTDIEKELTSSNKGPKNTY